MNELERELRKYKLDDLLLLLSQLSKEMYRDGTPIREVKWKRNIGRFQQTKRQPFPNHALFDIAYAVIRVSNDYRSKKPTVEDVYKFNDLYIGVSEEEAKIAIDECSDNDFPLSFVFGCSQKQFWYQDIIRGKKVYYNFLRYHTLLSEIPPYFPDYKLPTDDLKEITGFDINSFSQLLACAWAFIYTDSPIVKTDISDDLIGKIPILSKANLEKCLSFFMADYNFYRMDGHPNNPLFFKPIIKTSTGILIISNAFIWARKLYEGIYWLIRDKYMNESSNTFINNFGEYYERYIQEVLGYYLANNSFKKIKPLNNEKRADWLIHTKRYILVVEQKSCLMSIALKSEYPSLPDIAKYLENFKEAFLQIDSSVKSLGSTKKQIIKLVLHFETLYMKEGLLKSRVATTCKDEIDDLSHYFFIDTEEFERLIQVLADNENNFDEIIQAKIAYEGDPDIKENGDFCSMLTQYNAYNEIKFLESRNHYFDDLFGDL